VAKFSFLSDLSALLDAIDMPNLLRKSTSSLFPTGKIGNGKMRQVLGKANYWLISTTGGSNEPNLKKNL